MQRRRKFAHQPRSIRSRQLVVSRHQQHRPITNRQQRQPRMLSSAAFSSQSAEPTHDITTQQVATSTSTQRVRSFPEPSSKPYQQQQRENPFLIDPDLLQQQSQHVLDDTKNVNNNNNDNQVVTTPDPTNGVFPPLSAFPQAKTFLPDEQAQLLEETQESCRSSNKLFRFAKVSEFPTVFEPDSLLLKQQIYPLAGHWKSHYFQNDKPIVLELGCGFGQYVVSLALRDRLLSDAVSSSSSSSLSISPSVPLPSTSSEIPLVDKDRQQQQQQQSIAKNYIGLERRGNRLYIGACAAIAHNLQNVAFIRQSYNFLPRMFLQNEIDEIWITFPDPQFKNENKYPTSPSNLTILRHILRPGGIIHLKTDQDEVYSYTKEQITKNGFHIIQDISDVYRDMPLPDAIRHRAEVSNRHASVPILHDDGSSSPSGHFSLQHTLDHYISHIHAMVDEYHHPSDESKDLSSSLDAEILQTSAGSATPTDVLHIKTKYESIWAERGRTIKYLKFQVP